jgi:eukaryotic-like serine/threonine-protein kinase
MSLQPGQNLGHFVILSIIGRGGMGEVFRARDARLGRDVAIKILSEEFALEPDGLPRLHREARTLATLAHPGIAAIHGLDEQEGQRFLVLEYVPGDTLAELLARGPLPIHRALDIARQIALGLGAAHDKGIIHRDLKPANIKVGPDGRVKILDFGIAKTVAADIVRGDREATVTIQSTDAGMVIGTAAYMSPEQARGKEVDRRSDIWAFGCLLYESLTGRRAFSGETVTDIIAAVLAREPDWGALPAATPGRIRGLLRHCLERDRDRRLHHIADARIEIEDAIHSPADAEAPRQRRRWSAFVGFCMGLAAAALLAMSASRFGGPTAAPLRRLSLGTLPGAPLVQAGATPGLAVSRDGRRVAYIGGDEPQIYVRDLAVLTPRPIKGTAGATNPFFSPDGAWLGFTAGGKLRRVPVQGGSAEILSDLPSTGGASWSRDDTIVFAPACASGPSDCGLFRIPAHGGTAQPLTRADAGEHEVHSSPCVLPGGRAILFTAESGTQKRVRQIRAVSLEDGSQVTLVDGDTATYASGHLLYRVGCALFARPLHPVRLAFSGRGARLAADVHAFAASDDDTLFLATGCVPAATEIVVVDSAGPQRVPDLRYSYSSLAVAPDGNRVAVTITEGLEKDIAVLDLSRSETLRITSGEGQRERPAWAPDGQRIAYERREPEELRGLYWTPAAPGHPEEPLLLSKEPLGSITFTMDGDVVYERRTEGGGEAWILPLTGERTPRLLLAGAMNARFSPDGKWMAYELPSGRGRDVWVASYPDLRQRRVVSQGDGTDPVWSRDGKALYYRAATDRPARILRAPLELGSEAKAGLPVLFFDGPVEAGRRYDSAPGGDRIIALRGAEPRPMQITVVSSWSTEPR